MKLIIAFVTAMFVGVFVGLMMDEYRHMDRQERLEGIFLILFLIAVVVIGGVAH